MVTIKQKESDARGSPLSFYGMREGGSERGRKVRQAVREAGERIRIRSE